MRICYLASASSIHTRRWANHFAAQGHQVEIVSFDLPGELDKRVIVHALKKRWPLSVECFSLAPYVRRILNQSKVDILHAHYASSYGTLGRLCGLRPYVLSVWGSDVYEFPKRSVLHRELLKRNLSCADEVCSTSEVMAGEIRKYCNRLVTITPFGISCDQFRPPSDNKNGDDNEFVIGTVKTLEPIYGIDYLIRSFALLTRRYRGSSRLRLVIAGEGYLRPSLQKLARHLGVGSVTEFLGAAPHDEVPSLLRRLSVFANLSNSESFGVAALEASACELPVVATNVGNLPEIVRHNVTGIIVPPRNPESAAEAFLTLLKNSEIRRTLGTAGRQFVLQNYDWSMNAKRMEWLYNKIMSQN
jgi:glycosyltransferase involved in cell wall biosynthesis